LATLLARLQVSALSWQSFKSAAPWKFPDNSDFSEYVLEQSLGGSHLPHDTLAFIPGALRQKAKMAELKEGLSPSCQTRRLSIEVGDAELLEMASITVSTKQQFCGDERVQSYVGKGKGKGSYRLESESRAGYCSFDGWSKCWTEHREPSPSE
jgi:hypothetical protein